MSKIWTTQQAAELYLVKGWGSGFFSVNEAGHMEVKPNGKQTLDIKLLCDDLSTKGLTAPILLRFSDILKRRMKQIHSRFQIALQEADYQGRYYGVYPIKVNQQRQVVEEIVEFGCEFNWGLEAGSKPELHATLAMLEDVEGLIICNGYKDREFIELAMIGRKMGKQVFIVVEQANELNMILDASQRLGVEPLIGLRCKLAATSEGKWEDSGGDKSKFGLSASELMAVIEQLKNAGKLHCLRLLHFHIGSQVPRIRHIKKGMAEAARFFVEMCKMGVPIEFVDVGGGLGVNYDGYISGSSTSVDYSLQEYANDVVWTLKTACTEENLPHPHIISESGRALVAHHAVLIINVLEVSHRANGEALYSPAADAPLQLRQLWQTWVDFEAIAPREILHDTIALRDDVNRLFSLGHCSLAQRGMADNIYWHILERLMPRFSIEEIDELVPGLRCQLADRYFCNFSLFQSLPDAWAIDQVFPVVPIQRLDEEPTRRGVLVDITCDSDGKLQNFPLASGYSSTLPLHTIQPNEDYLIGVFLTGAYQEILGDLHNLFGDTHAVHVRMDGDGYEFEQIVEGETVAEVLEYVQFNEKVLLDRMRRQLTQARTEQRITASEANQFLRFYSDGLNGYTYLEELTPGMHP